MPGSKKSNIQIIMIFAIVIGAFISSLLFFLHANTNTVKDSLETETDLVSQLLSASLSASLEEKSLMEGRGMEAAGEQTSLNTYFQKALDEGLKMAGTETGEHLCVWIVTADGQVVYSSDEVGEVPLPVTVEDLPGEEGHKGKGDEALPEEYALWIGPANPMWLSQELCVVRSLDTGGGTRDSLYLILLNRCISIRAQQRREYSLLISIELILLFTMIVLLTNTVFSFRRQIIRLATTDELTGLANRKSFHVTWQEFIKGNTPPDYSLFLIDIDFFKQINDNYGHACGDLALKTLAEHIAAMVGEHGGFAGRWGGDEFIGILPLDGPRGEEALDQLCRGIRAARMEEGFQITISVGVAYADGEKDLARLSELADLALYHSKEAGRNQVSLYAPGMGAEENQAGQEYVARNGAAGQDAPAGGKTSRGDGRHRNTGGEASSPGTASGSIGGNIWQRLLWYLRTKLLDSTLTGVRWMAPFVAGGGLLIGLAFLFDAASVDISSLSVTERADFGSLTWVSSVLKNLGGTTFNFMLPIFAGFMAYGLAGENAFMAGFVGGYMTIATRSGFIGAMIAGFAAGVIAIEMQQFIGRAPKFIQTSAPILIYPIFNLLLMQLLSNFVILPLSNGLGAIFTSALDAALARGSSAAGALAAGMMAVDMGGIVNKVAYNYAVSGLSAGQTQLMASVMAGGMVPPIGIFLSTLCYREKFSDIEHEQSLGTLFMGLSFITEGALPYAFTDVFRVIPSCIAGSALAGLLSSLFGCALPAPHGGIFVVPVMAKPLFYILAVFAGSSLTAVLLGKWKKSQADKKQPEKGRP